MKNVYASQTTATETIVILDPEKVYYLSHPLTTYGKVEINYAKEELAAGMIEDLNEGDCGLIRPLVCLPDVRITSMDQETAMQKCIQLLSIADGIILCPGWKLSSGCQQEFNYAKDQGKEIVFFEDLVDCVNG